MKLEQACRFRMDSGYGICARSEGFTAENETNFGTVFNDVMNPLFGKMGQQILTCTASGSDMFFARCTMRSDINGRKTMFTNACVLPLVDYEREMIRDPAFLLRLPAQELMSYQPADSIVAPLDLREPDVTPDLTQLREKYALNDERYAELLMLGYRAITGNGALCLRTSCQQEDTEEMVRELTYCVAMGLMPMLRGKLSFSNGQDARMNICVAAVGGGQAVRAPGSAFPVEPVSGIQPMRGADELTAKFFMALAGCGDDERQTLLADMESWLEKLSGSVAEGVTLAMIVAAYYLSGKGAYSGVDAVRLLSSVLISTRNRGLNMQTVDAVMAQLLEQIVQEQVYPGKLLPALTDRYLASESGELCAAVEQILPLSDVEDCVAMIEELIARPCTAKERTLASCMLDRIHQQADALDEQQFRDVLAWVLDNNVAEQVNYCADVLESCETRQCRTQVIAILEAADGRAMKSAEEELLNFLLGRLIESRDQEGMCLTEVAQRVLDTQHDTLCQDLKETALSYLELVRLHEMRSMEVRIAVLEQLAKSSRNLFLLIGRKLQEEGNPLWENFQASAHLTPGQSPQELATVAQTYNTFLESEGVFEQKLLHLWTQQMQQKLYETEDLATRVKLIEGDAELIRVIQASKETRQKIWAADRVAFWNATAYAELLEDTHTPIPQLLRDSEDPVIKKKLRVMNCTRNLMKKGAETRDICLLVDRTDEYLPEELADIRRALLPLAKKVAGEQRILSWDLLLLHCGQTGENGVEYNCQKVVALVEQMSEEHLLGRDVSGKAGDSRLLERDSNLSKKLRKAASGKDLRQLQRLVEELTPEKGALLDNITGFASNFGNFFSKESEKSAPNTARRKRASDDSQTRDGKGHDTRPGHNKGGKRIK